MLLYMYMKTCKKCKQELELVDFYKNKVTVDGLTIYCINCLKLKNKIYRKSINGKNQTRKYNRKYNNIPENREMINLKMRNTIHIGRAWAHLSDVTPEYLKEVLQENIKCPLCNNTFSGRIKKHIDHIIPINRGGLHLKNNIRVICANCNLTLPK